MEKDRERSRERDKITGEGGDVEPRVSRAGRTGVGTSLAGNGSELGAGYGIGGSDYAGGRGSFFDRAVERRQSRAWGRGRPRDDRGRLAGGWGFPGVSGYPLGGFAPYGAIAQPGYGSAGYGAYGSTAGQSAWSPTATGGYAYSPVYGQAGWTGNQGAYVGPGFVRPSGTDGVQPPRREAGASVREDRAATTKASSAGEATATRRSTAYEPGPARAATEAGALPIAVAAARVKMTAADGVRAR